MFYKNPSGHYRVRPFDGYEWLVHGFGTRDARMPEGRMGVLGEGDALLENAPGCAVAVKTADCIPMLFADVRHRAVAAVHAGWRGTAGRIGPAALLAMRERFGTAPEDLRAAIGPGIGVCCYQVGPEVAAQLGGREPRKVIVVPGRMVSVVL